MNMLPSRETIVHAFRIAAAHDDVVALAHLLDARVVAITDSAGDVIAPAGALRGRDEVIPEAIANLSLRSGADVTEHRVNAAPGLVVRRSGRVVAILNFGIERGSITHVWITRSPQKLRRWNIPE